MEALISRLNYYMCNIVATAETGVDFYNQNTGNGEGGGSILPFLGFMCSVVAIVLLGVGVVRYFSAKSRFNMFFDRRDQSVETPSEEQYAKEMKSGKIWMILGAVFMVLSFVLL